MKYISDRAEIAEFIDDLRKEPWLGAARRWWPKYVFHFTDILNAVQIIKEGYLHSRTKLEIENKLLHDNASPQIISQTDDEYKKWGRFYFRPRTPTQYCNEGFRPKDKLELGAHCPFPVYFMFDSKEVLSYAGTKFSSGSLAKHSVVGIGGDSTFLKSIPFEMIYHNLPIDQGEDKIEIKFRRHAEVVFPGSISLDALKYIVCRSKAELETLINLLGIKASNFKIVQDRRLFECKWTYVSKVDLSHSQIKIFFNDDTSTPGPFDLKAKVVNLIDQSTQKKHISDYYTIRSPLILNFRSPKSTYRIIVELDGYLAFRGDYRE